MRILAITNLYPNPLQPHRGTFNRQQFRALAESHAVRVIAPIAWTDERSARKAGCDSLPKNRRVECDGLVVDHPRYWFTPRVLRGCYGRFFRHSVQRTFERALSEFRPDLILSAWAYPDGWAAVELGRQAGLPVVVKVHGSDILTLAHVPGRGKPTARAMRHADGVVAVSRDLADKVVRMGADPARVTVVYDGIDSTRFHPGSKAEARQRIGIGGGDEPVILFVGNLVPVKGIDVLIDACARLVRGGDGVRCFIVGQGPLRQTLEQQAARLGIADNINFVGPVLHANLPDWFRAADVFVLPSHSEGVPCVLLEAAGCRTPYVASRVGGIPEIADWNRGETVAPGDAGSLAEAISRMLSTTGERAADGDRKTFDRSHADAAGEIGVFCERVLNDYVRPMRITNTSPTSYVVTQPKAS